MFRLAVLPFDAFRGNDSSEVLDASVVLSRVALVARGREVRLVVCAAARKRFDVVDDCREVIEQSARSRRHRSS